MTRRSETALEAQKQHASVAASRSFAPLARADARILILGSLPGQRSLAAGEYYAHPQNAFWRIMAALIGARGSYAERCATLLDNGIAVWDVLYESVRPGSMDADIQLDTAQANDFSMFFRRHPNIRRVCFNGQKAAAMFRRLATTEPGPPHIEHLILPSTSPAYASMSYVDKLAMWRDAVLSGD